MRVFISNLIECDFFGRKKCDHIKLNGDLKRLRRLFHTCFRRQNTFTLRLIAIFLGDRVEMCNRKIPVERPEVLSLVKSML